MAANILERFFEKIEFVPIAGCWLWTGTIIGARAKYGAFNIGRGNMTAHRFSWEIHNGREVPWEMHVLHKCDVPSCVNPAHLFIGTHAENMLDMKLKGRAKSGNPESSFTKAEIAFMLSERMRGITCMQLATQFGAAHCTISNLTRKAGFPALKRLRLCRL